MFPQPRKKAMAKTALEQTQIIIKTALFVLYS